MVGKENEKVRERKSMNWKGKVARTRGNCFNVSMWWDGRRERDNSRRDI
jgi:hypothetical protein